MIWSERPAWVRTPATSANLGPGFDALGLALGLHDQIEARIAGDGLTVEVSGEGAETADAGERHLVVRAMRAAFERMGGQPPGIALRCANAIPHARGLGSSAAAIVSGLLAARALVSDGEARLPDEAVFRLAVDMEGHPDNVAACLAGGLTIAWAPRPWPGMSGGTGKAGPRPGGRRPAGARSGPAGAARLISLTVPEALTAVACVPPFPVATEAARRALPPTVPHADAAANASRSALLIAALTGAPDVLFDATEDFLHQQYRAAVMPETAGLVALLRDAGFAAVVSGAGPTVLVLTFAGREQTSGAVDSIARETGNAWRVIPLDVDRQGAQVQSGGLGVHPPASARRASTWSQFQRPGAGHAGCSPHDRRALSPTHRPPSKECRGLAWC